MTSQRVPGHALRHGGKVTAEGHTRPYSPAICQCGWISNEDLATDVGRKQTHREHKADVLRYKEEVLRRWVERQKVR